MPTLWITSRYVTAKLQSERIIITATCSESDLPETRNIPLIDVDLVMLGRHVTIATSLIHKLLDRQIPVFLMDGIGRCHGQFLPAIPAHGKSRLEQYHHHTRPDSQAHVAANLIEAKIYNQRRSLQRLALNRKETESTSGTFRRFNTAIHRLTSSTLTVDQIMGIEGASSSDFYCSWAHFLPDEFPFGRRTRRPPLNPVNACLSFASTLLYQEMTSATFAAGLDPAIGSLHSTENGRWSLPLDLIEPLRPVVIEPLTLDLFSRQILNSLHFEPQNNGIYLTREGRNKLILQYEKRMERYFHSEHLGQRTSLRQTLRQLPLNYKKHLSAKTPFTPFKMN